MEIVRLGPDDVDDMAGVHLAAFPASALSFLGREAVRRYYAWQLLGPHDAVALGARSGAILVGFCCGGTFRGALSGFVRRNRAFLAAAVLRRPALLASSAFRRRGLRAIPSLWRHRAPGSPAPPTAGSTSFGILVVAVVPDSRRRGVGAALLEAAGREAATRGHRRMNLTVAPANGVAIAFYEACGWRRRGPGELEKIVDG